MEITPGQVINSPYESILAYAATKYRGKFEAERKNCPYDTSRMDDEILVFKHQMM